MVDIGEAQKNRLAQRLAMASHNREDSGQLLEATARALQSGEDGSASQLEALVHAFENERVIVPIRVEADPRVTGIHAGEAGHDPVGFLRVETLAGPAWKDQELRDLLFRQAQDECSSIIDLSVEYAGMGVCRVSLVIDPQAVEEADRAQLREKVLHTIDVLNSNKRLRAVADDIQWVPRWGTVAG